MFQWSLEGGLRFRAIFWPCLRPWGSFSDSYSSRDEVLSPRKRGKGTLQANSPPGCLVQMVWSLKPLKERGDMGSPVSSMASLDATSNKTGCCTTSLISEMFTNRRRDAVNLSSDSSLEPMECHTFCYIVGLGLDCKFIDLLIKRSNNIFIKISLYLNFIVFEIISKQTDILI